MMRCFLTAIGLAALAACVPADDAVGLGSVQFTFTSSKRTLNGIIADETRDGYALSFDRVLLSFKTMTVGKIGAPDTCSYRGRGATSDAVFDAKFGTGLVQTFNGISPVLCPDVGVIFGEPDNATILDNGGTSDQLVELAEQHLHALIDVTATPDGSEDNDFETTPYKIQLRFEPIYTSTRFGGCREATRGVKINVGERQTPSVYFAAENLFREAISNSVAFRIHPFAQADANRDHVVTMDELDALPLTEIPEVDSFYQVPPSDTGTNEKKDFGDFASLGDFVRFLFRFTLLYQSENGLCVGNEPGSTTDTQ
jgi:hypothetical protein